MEIHVAKRSVYFRRTHVNYQSYQSSTSNYHFIGKKLRRLVIIVSSALEMRLP